MNEKNNLFYFTNTGGVRPHNEDGLLIPNKIIVEESMETTESSYVENSVRLICVADGIGGERRGEVASRLVLTYLRDHINTITDQDTLISTLQDAKDYLDIYAAENPESFNLGCTIAGIFFTEENVVAFNAGDCRVYRIQGKYFERVTKDHSIVYSMFEEGTISEEEMRHHPRKNIVTSSISGDGSPHSLRVYIHPLKRRVDDTYFICSDGIWSCFSLDELEMIYEKYKGYEFCDRLLVAALARRASDNISAILIHLPSL